MSAMNCDRCGEPMKELFTSVYCDCPDDPWVKVWVGPLFRNKGWETDRNIFVATESHPEQNITCWFEIRKSVLEVCVPLSNSVVEVLRVPQGTPIRHSNLPDSHFE